MKMKCFFIILMTVVAVMSAERLYAEQTKPVENKAAAVNPDVAPAAASQAPAQPQAPKIELPTTWTQPPVIQISKWGEELKIEVMPDAEMTKEIAMTIDSVSLESEKGELLGTKTFEQQEPARRAEFMVDPKALKMEQLKIAVHSAAMGDWSALTPLKVTVTAAPPPAAPPQAKAVATKAEVASQEKVAKASPKTTPGEMSKKKRKWVW
jgi:hypothetical protein